jgi:hypothetical protein
MSVQQSPPDFTANAQRQTKPLQDEPVTQQKGRRRPNWWPEWAKQLPYMNLPPVKQNFSLISRKRMYELIGNASQDTKASVEADLQHLEKELMPLFNEVDRQASLHQNRYRLVQILFIVLATLATIIGSLLALCLGSEDTRTWVPMLSFAETVVALAATFLATISGREAALPKWLENRRKAESLRREFFRFLVDLPPYDELESYRRKMLLSERAALINQGRFPEESSVPIAPGGPEGTNLLDPTRSVNPNNPGNVTTPGKANDGTVNG